MRDVALNLSFVLRDLPEQRRADAAAKAGFTAIESGWPSNPTGFARAITAAGLTVALLNLPAGDLTAGWRGIANRPQLAGQFAAGLEQAGELCELLRIPVVNLLAGRDDGTSLTVQRGRLAESAARAIELLSPLGTSVATEAISRTDSIDYLLPSAADVTAFAHEYHLDLGVQLDLFHIISDGRDAANEIATAGSRLRHIQLADMPGRCAPGAGTLDLAAIVRSLDSSDYRGAIGLEYIPRTDPLAEAATARTVVATATRVER